MRHFVYPENEYKRTNPYGTLKFEHDPDYDVIRVTILKGSGGTTLRLPTGAAAMLAGFLLSKQPTLVKGDAMAFSPVTRGYDAIHEPDFTVIPPGHELLAKPEKKDTTINVTALSSLDAKRAAQAFADALRAENDAPKSGPEPVLTAAQYEELQRIKAQASAPADTETAKDDEQDIGDLHPDQERRLTALREANGILGGRLGHDRVLEWAEWILNGNTGKED